MRVLPCLFALVVTVPYVSGYADDKPVDKPAAAAAKKMSVDRVAAIVNDAVILRSELELRMLPLVMQAKDIPDAAERQRRVAQLGPQMLEQMVNDELMYQAAMEAKVTVDQSEVQSLIDWYKKEYNWDEKELAQALKAQGLTVDNLKKDLVRQRAISTLLVPKMQLGEDDVKRRYEEMKGRAANASKVMLRQIIINVPEHATEQQLKDATARARDAVDQANNGASFGDLAKAVSDEPGAKTTGGLIGWIDPDHLDAAFEPVVMGMSKGDTRGPVKAPSTKALMVFHADDVQVTPMKPYGEMKGELTKQLREKELQKLTQAWVTELRKKAYVEIKL